MEVNHETIMSTRSHCRGYLAATAGTLTCSLAVVLLDVVLDGNYLWSAIVCPIWVIVGVVRTVLRRPRWTVAVARLLLPVVTGSLAVANNRLQESIAMGNAARVIQACEDYRQAKGVYPGHLEDLVPHYLNTVPRVKYCCWQGEFGYSAPPQAILRWYAFPPFGRLAYASETGTWRYVD